ncbi:hypothetical protein ACRPHP_16610 [Pantoea allii]|uniref:hypothetical protein n=1 Tax=Pantoea allii TaxID=574096 RepID=UPI003D79649D
MKSKGIIICLCDITGIMAKPWIENGYEAILVDPQHPEGVHVDGAITRVGHIIDHPETWSVLRKAIASGRVVFVMGFPPCTDLAVSGARWFETKRTADPAFQHKAMHVVWQCQIIGQMSGAPWAFENPVSQISTLWRRSDFSFHPYEFTEYEPGDNYTKKTCLWVGGGFVMPPAKAIESLGKPDNTRIWYGGKSIKDRANFRSATPLGFAIAVFESNAPHLRISEVENAA